MPDRVGHDRLVVGHDADTASHKSCHSRANGNPWMPVQVGHDRLVVPHHRFAAVGARLGSVVIRLEPVDDS